MSTLTVSSKFQIVIPARIRESLGIEPGDRLHAIEYNGRIELVPLKSLDRLRETLKGIDSEVPRDPDRV